MVHSWPTSGTRQHRHADPYCGSGSRQRDEGIASGVVEGELGSVAGTSSHRQRWQKMKLRWPRRKGPVIPTAEPVDPNYCQACGAKLLPTDRRCMGCGQDVCPLAQRPTMKWNLSGVEPHYFLETGHGRCPRCASPNTAPRWGTEVGVRAKRAGVWGGLTTVLLGRMWGALVGAGHLLAPSDAEVPNSGRCNYCRYKWRVKPSYSGAACCSLCGYRTIHAGGGENASGPHTGPVKQWGAGQRRGHSSPQRLRRPVIPQEVGCQLARNSPSAPEAVQ